MLSPACHLSPSLTFPNKICPRKSRGSLKDVRRFISLNEFTSRMAWAEAHSSHKPIWLPVSHGHFLCSMFSMLKWIIIIIAIYLDVSKAPKHFSANPGKNFMRLALLWSPFCSNRNQAFRKWSDLPKVIPTVSSRAGAPMKTSTKILDISFWFCKGA